MLASAFRLPLRPSDDSRHPAAYAAGSPPSAFRPPPSAFPSPLSSAFSSYSFQTENILHSLNPRGRSSPMRDVVVWLAVTEGGKMLRKRLDLTWPILGVLVCLFILIEQSPRSWEQVARSEALASQPRIAHFRHRPHSTHSNRCVGRRRRSYRVAQSIAVAARQAGRSTCQSSGPGRRRFAARTGTRVVVAVAVIVVAVVGEILPCGGLDCRGCRSAPDGDCPCANGDNSGNGDNSDNAPGRRHRCRVATAAGHG